MEVDKNKLYLRNLRQNRRDRQSNRGHSFGENRYHNWKQQSRKCLQFVPNIRKFHHSEAENIFRLRLRFPGNFMYLVVLEKNLAQKF